MATHSAFNIDALIRETEDILREGLALTPLPLDPDAARAEGTFKSAPVVLETRLAAAPRASAAYLDFPARSVDIARATDPAPERVDAASRAQSEYLSDHRTQDKGLGMLAKMFGASWAAGFVDGVLFPSS